MDYFNFYWKAIQAYFQGDVTKCVEHLEEALKMAQDSNQPIWVIKDILIDLRNAMKIYGCGYQFSNWITESDVEVEIKLCF